MSDSTTEAQVGDIIINHTTYIYYPVMYPEGYLEGYPEAPVLPEPLPEPLPEVDHGEVVALIYNAWGLEVLIYVSLAVIIFSTMMTMALFR